MKMPRRSYALVGSMVVAVSLALGGCAAPKINTRSQTDPSVNLASYHTYNFVAEPGTNRGGYSTLVTSYFKSSVTTMLEARGYKYSAENPDLLVNFYMNTRDRSETRPNMGGGYYGYRNGLYGGWPMYQETVNYQVGTINLDLVDAAKKQLIWEGVSEGRVTEESLANPKVTVNAIVTELLRKYPGKPNM